MKKGNFVLSILILLCVAFYPCVANAASGAIFGASDKAMTNTTLDGNTVTIENKGEDATNIYLGVNVTSGTVKEYNATLKLQNSHFTFKKSRKETGWTGTITKDSTDPSIIHISLKNDAGVTTGKNLVATIGLEVSAEAASTETCTIGLTPAGTTETPKCQIVDGKYYDDKGNEVTEAEYKTACDAPENPQTGSFLPYAVIIAGVAIAGGLYFVTKKNKIYHI